jgi:hypothetical protein
VDVEGSSPSGMLREDPSGTHVGAGCTLCNVRAFTFNVKIRSKTRQNIGGSLIYFMSTNIQKM